MEAHSRAHEPAAPVARKPHGALALALLCLTLLSCSAAGAVFAYGYFAPPRPEASLLAALTSPKHLALGLLLYGAPLVAILAAHEAAHYVAMRRAGMAPGLPFFIPFPPPFGLTGTFGALINLRERAPTRRAALHIAASGPLAGLVVAIGVLLVGFALTPERIAPLDFEDAGGGLTIQTPLLYDWLADTMGVPEDAPVHPLAVAGWLGLFLTSVQLIPGGQLDGGHIARSLLGHRARLLGWATLAALLVGAYWFPGYALLAAVVWLTGLRRPLPVEPGCPTRRDIALGLACVLVLAVTFVPVPLAL